jgi:hypothetical protein
MRTYLLKYSDQTLEEVVRRWEAGNTLVQISAFIGVSKGRANKVINRLRLANRISWADRNQAGYGETLREQRLEAEATYAKEAAKDAAKDAAAEAARTAVS